MPFSETYLDIETTGLDPSSSYITVVGIFHDNDGPENVLQLVGKDITPDNLLKAIGDTHTLYTYNGSGFDLPFIQRSMGVDLNARVKHRDLMFDCWRNNLYGGLKKVEMQLGIRRTVLGVDGKEAIRLWWQYLKMQDHDSLRTLLDYNREDLINLKTLREMLATRRTV